MEHIFTRVLCFQYTSEIVLIYVPHIQLHSSPLNVFIKITVTVVVAFSLGK